MFSIKRDWWKKYCWNRCGINEKYCWNRSGLMKRILLK